MVKYAIFPDILEKSLPPHSSYLDGSHPGLSSWVNEGRSKNLHVLLFFAGKSGMEVGMGWPLYERDRQGLCNSLGCLRTQKSASQVLGDM